MVESQPQRTSPALPTPNHHRREDQGPVGQSQTGEGVPGQGVGREGLLAPAALATRPSRASVSSPIRHTWPSLPCSAVMCISHSVNKQLPSPTRQGLSGEVQMPYGAGASPRPRTGPGEHQTSRGPASRVGTGLCPEPQALQGATPGLQGSGWAPQTQAQDGTQGREAPAACCGRLRGCHAGTHRAPGSKVRPQLYGASLGLSVHGPLGRNWAPAFAPTSHGGAV